MADVNIASFDLDAAGAIRAVTQLSGSIKSLEKELEQLQKEGKDTTVVQQKLAAATSSLDKILKQETTTARGAAAQVKALNVVTKDLANSQEKANKSGKGFGSIIGKNALSFKSFAAGLARGGTALANLAGGLGLAGGALTVVNFAAEKAIEGFLNLFKESEAVAAAKERLNNATETAITGIVGETRANNALFAELKSGNTTQERRREIVKKLQEQYPDIIGKTNLLTASEGELKKIQDLVNANIRKRILAQTQEAQIAEIVAKIAKNQVDIERTRQEEQLITSEAAARQRAELQKNAELNRQLTNDLRAQGRSEQEIAKIISDINEKELKQIEAKKKANEDAITGIKARAQVEENKALLVELANIGAAYKKLDEILADIDFGISIEPTEQSGRAAAKTAAEQKALEGSLAALRAEQARLNKETEEATKIKDDERLKSLSAQYVEVTKAITEAEKKIAAYRGETGLLEGSLASLQNAANEIQKVLREQTSADDIEKLQKLQDEYDALQAKIKEVEDSLKKVEEVEPKGVLELDLDAAKAALSQLQAQQAAANLALQQRENEALKATKNNAQAQAVVRENFAKQAAKAEIDQRLAVLRVQQQIAQAELNLAIEASGAVSEESLKAQQDLLEIQRQIAELEGREFVVDVKVKTDKDDLKKTLEEVASFAEDLAKQVLDFAGSQVDNTIAQLEGAIDKQKSLLDELLGNEDTANAERVRLEQERLDALNKEREKAKNKEAIIAQAQIAINLALAVARATAQAPLLAAFTISAALAAAIFGFVQSKQAAQQAFYEGSLFVDDPRAPRGRDTIQARLNRGEAVIPTDTNARYKKAIHGIYHERVPAQIANDFFANNSQWVEAMQAYKQGLISPQIQPVPVPVSAGAGAQKSTGDALPLASALGYVGRTISEQPRAVLRGNELVTIVKNKSSKLDKIRNKSKGKNA